MQSAVVVDTNVGQFRHAVQIDQRRRRGDAKIHHRHEALPSGQKPRVFSLLRDQRDCAIYAVDGVVVEFGRFHFRFPPIDQSLNLPNRLTRVFRIAFYPGGVPEQDFVFTKACHYLKAGPGHGAG